MTQGWRAYKTSFFNQRITEQNLPWLEWISSRTPSHEQQRQPRLLADDPPIPEPGLGHHDHFAVEVSALEDLHGRGAAVVSLSGGRARIVVHSKRQSWVQVGGSFVYVVAEKRKQ